MPSLVGSEMCIRDSICATAAASPPHPPRPRAPPGAQPSSRPNPHPYHPPQLPRAQLLPQPAQPLGARAARAALPADHDGVAHDLRLRRVLAADVNVREVLFAAHARPHRGLEGPRDDRGDERRADRVQQRQPHRDGALDEPGDPRVDPGARRADRGVRRAQDPVEVGDGVPLRHLPRSDAGRVGGEPQRRPRHHPHGKRARAILRRAIRGGAPFKSAQFG